VQDHCFRDRRTEQGHPVSQPRGYTAAMQREIGVAGALHVSIVAPPLTRRRISLGQEGVI
jgi:hypothetical protein